MREHFVIDPLISKRQQLLLATQLCRMVLKVSRHSQKLSTSLVSPTPSLRYGVHPFLYRVCTTRLFMICIPLLSTRPSHLLCIPRPLQPQSWPSSPRKGQHSVCITRPYGGASHKARHVARKCEARAFQGRGTAARHTRCVPCALRGCVDLQCGASCGIFVPLLVLPWA